MTLHHLAVVVLSVWVFACGAGSGNASRGSNAANAAPAENLSAATPPPPARGANTNSNTNANEVSPMPTKQPARALGFEARLRVEGGKVLISYRVTNNTGQEVLLVNRGDTESGLGAGRVYVDPQPDGVVELSQRAFRQPADRLCPAREVPPYPGVSRLRAGQSAAEEVAIDLPLRYRTTFADCSPAPQMPAPVRRVKFCLGVIRGGGKAVAKENGAEVITHGQLIGTQELLCGDVFELP